jgi:hypothetical protein
MDACMSPIGHDGGVGGHGYNNPTRAMLVPRAASLSPRQAGLYANVADATLGSRARTSPRSIYARAVAGRRAGVAATPLLADDAQHRARALWVLDRIGGDFAGIVPGDFDRPAFRPWPCGFAAARQ